MKAKTLPLRPIHSFPARMAASIALDELRHSDRPLRVLDPMVGSGTTLVVAKSLGHDALGFDTDPLAVLLARTWCLDVDQEVIRKVAQRVETRARGLLKDLSDRDAYPCQTKDEETKSFVRYWFDRENRRQLTAVSKAIRVERDETVRDVLWCSFSRLIIAKERGVSLAMDLSHSRPHKVRNKAPIKLLKHFSNSVEAVLSLAPFNGSCGRGVASAALADARRLPIPSNSVDLVITSPPYLNAIDYVRCHKFTLVWMGYSIKSLREIRSSNIGTEIGLTANASPELERIAKLMVSQRNELPVRYKRILARYVSDIDYVIAEIKRVLIPGGRATFVVGNSTLKNAFIRNSTAIALLSKHHGLDILRSKSRVIPDTRRYLPPPSRSTGTINKRMRTEVVMTFCKPLDSDDPGKLKVRK